MLFDVQKYSLLIQSIQYDTPENRPRLPVLVRRRLFFRSSWTPSHVSRPMIAGCVSGNTFRSSGKTSVSFSTCTTFSGS